MTPENKRIPCTKRIAGELEQKIRDGILRTGTKLPSVRELAETYHTCTSVCLSVYRALEKKQLVQREPGRGTFVCRSLPPEVKEYVTSWNGIYPHAKMSAFLDRVFADNGLEHWRQNPFYTDQYSESIDYLEFSGKAMSHPGTLAMDEGLLPVFADRDLLYPLDDFLDRSRVLRRTDFPEKLLKTFSYRGKLYALPFLFSPVMLIYHKRLFRECGMPEPLADWTWEELYRNTELLTRSSDDGKHILQYGLGILFTFNSYIPFIIQNGGELFDANGNCVLSSRNAFEALHFFSELFALPGVCSHKFGDPRSALADLMANDLMAMMIGDAVDYQYLTRKLPPDQVGILPLPARRLRSTSLSAHGWAIHRNCRTPEAHFRFLEHLYTSPGLGELCRHPDFPFPAFHPEDNGVPEPFLEALEYARPALTSPSPTAVKMLCETVSTLLGHKMILTPEKAKSFETKINISL